MDYLSNRRSDPNGQSLILSIEPNGAPPGAALRKVIGEYRWYALRDVILDTQEWRCETCGFCVEPEEVSYLHVHEHWHHTKNKTALDAHFGLICRDCHNVMHIIWVRHTLPLGMDRFREHFCMVNGVDEKEFKRHLKWALKAASPAVPPPADYRVWTALVGVKERKAIQSLARTILGNLPKTNIDGSNWPAIEIRRRALAERKGEEKRIAIEKAERKAERERRKRQKLIRLGLIPPDPSPERFDLEPLMQQAMEEYGDWRI
jgi:hypothetical protein